MSAEEDDVTRIVLACDESGAKGYADKDEQVPGEVGVFAGLFAPREHVLATQQEFDDTARRFASPDGKLHITALPPEQQQALREAMYALIRKHRLPCFWEAIHVAGFHRVFTQHSDSIAKARTASRSGVKVSGKPQPPSLHVTLFQGLYSKVLAFCMEREKLRVDIEVRTDKVDSPIAQNFEAAANALLDFGAKIKSVSAFDPKTKQVLKAQIRSAAVHEKHRLPIVVENLGLTVVDHIDGIVVAADVLSNSLYYLFRKRSPEERYTALNTVEAVAQHPLHDHLDTYWNWGSYNFTDTYYAHPLDPMLKRS